MRKKDTTSLRVEALVLLRAALKLGSLCSLLSVTLVSCVPTPKKVGVRGDIPDSTANFLKEGITTRDEVLLHLGLPDLANQQETLFIYRWSTAWDVFVGGAYQSAPVGGSSELREDFALRIEFDDHGIVKRFEKAKEDLSDDSDFEALVRETIDPCYMSPSCERAGTLTDAKLYTNDEAGFSIQFPRKWEVRCGQGPVIVRAGKEVSEGFLPIFPNYVLSVQVKVYPVAVNADISSLDRSSFLKNVDCCPDSRTCNREITVIESEETTLDGVQVLSEVYEIVEIVRERHAYQLYLLGPNRFGNQMTDSCEWGVYRLLLVYWYVQKERLYQVTGEVFSSWGNEEVKEGFEKHRKTLEEVLRSFHLNDQTVNPGTSK